LQNGKVLGILLASAKINQKNREHHSPKYLYELIAWKGIQTIISELRNIIQVFSLAAWLYHMSGTHP
jgi:hypothetical protein